MMRRSTRRIGTTLLLLLAIVAAAACTRGGRSKEQQKEGAHAAKEAPAVKGVSKDWLEGRLPPSVLEGEPKPGGEVVVQVYSDPPSLNPLVDSDWWAARMMEHNVLEALLSYDWYADPDYPVVPELAERYEVSDDHLTYTFHLRKGVKWHDGMPFTADDVIATFDKMMDPTTKSVHVRAYFQELDSYEKVDDYTVVFHYKKPYFLVLDTFADFPILPAHIIGKLSGTEFNQAATNPLNRHPIGTGPFKFVEWEADQKIVVERNEDYWGRKAYLDRIVYRIVKDATVSEQLAAKEELDVWTRILPEQWIKMDNPVFKEKFNRFKLYEANYAWIGWNMKRPFFSDKRVRRAMTMLIDRPGIIEKVMYGLPLPTQCHFYFKSKACPDLPPIPYDPAGAVKLLEEAGWKDSDGDGVRDKDGIPFKFTFMIPASSVQSERMATKMKEDFTRAGIDMAIQKVEWAAFTKRLREKEFDACTLLWGGGPRGDPTQIWHSSSIEGGSNYVSFSNPEADRLMEEARVTFDPEKRNALYREFGKILYEEQPYTWLYVRPRLELLHKRIKGARSSLLYWKWSDWWVDDAAVATSKAAPEAKAPPSEENAAREAATP
ncbi:MAG: hypothetical protein D6729_08735 [Deltaproteobacteria bacterium]|nr:MAG: hypothetical protein D6729_08735 [Deltaproteobacteria bacterium]